MNAIYLNDFSSAEGSSKVLDLLAYEKLSCVQGLMLEKRET